MSTEKPDTWRRRVFRHVRKWLRRAMVAAISVLLTVVVMLIIEELKKPDLHAWHRYKLKGEFKARDAKEGFTFDDYLKVEDGLFSQVKNHTFEEKKSSFSNLMRYVPGGPNDPKNFDRDWNRSFELVPDKIRGGVVLLHGLSDSPYSMRSIAEVYHENGFYVLAPRLPGHGTLPSAMLDMSYRDWRAAVELAVEHVRQRITDEQPLHMCGYSNGGTLTLLYAVDSLGDEDLRIPDRIFLFSPAIGITPFARASNIHKLVSWMPWFEKVRWVSVEPEYDPFKYNSFTKNAGAQSWTVTTLLQLKITQAAAAGRLSKLPPIVTFQSFVDATIVARRLFDKLYMKLPAGGESEVVIFDVNQLAEYDGFLNQDYTQVIDSFQQASDLPFRLTLITNENRNSLAVVETTKPPRSTESVTRPLDLRWPGDAYSLSHVAIPFPRNDPLYGAESDRQISIGRLTPRGERSVLKIPPDLLLRIRSNPFHPYMMERIAETLKADADS